MFKARILVAAVALAALADISSSYASDIYVGPKRKFTTFTAGVSAAAPGDTILVDAGTYTNQWVTTSVPLTIIGLGAGAVLQVRQPISNHKGIIVANADLHVSNITFQGARVTVSDGNNGAGIRMQMGNLMVSNCRFTDNQDGILANPNVAASVTVDGSTFSGNGAGDGYSHAIYVNAVANFTVTNSTFVGTKVGHDIKSRAYKTIVRNTVLDDGVSGTTSYAVDIPNGGIASLDGLKISQGPSTQNPTMVSYGEEGMLYPNNSLTVSNSTFTNTRPGSSIGVKNTSTVSAQLNNDTFSGVATPVQGPGQIVSGAASPEAATK